MKKLIILSVLFINYSFSQDLDTNSISKVFQVEGKNASELFSSINLAVANIFNSANDVVQLNDPETKKMVIKAQCDIIIPNATKPLMPKNPYLKKTESYRIDYTFNIASRDGRYRVEIVYNEPQVYVTPSQYTPGGWMDTQFQSIMNPSQEYINENVEVAKRTAKAAKYSAKKKKQAYIDGIPNIIQFFSDELVNYANGVFLSINGKVLNADKKDDDW